MTQDYPEQPIGEKLRSVPIRPLDLTGRERQLRSAMSAMDRIGQNFVRYARRSMPFLVRQHARLTAGTVQLGPMTDDDFGEGPVYAIQVGPADTVARGAIILNPYAIAATVEGSLGGGANATLTAPTGDLTPAQRALLKRVARSLAVDLCAAVQEEVGLSWKPIECDPPVVGDPADDSLQVVCAIEGLSVAAKIAVMASAEALETAAREHVGDDSAREGDPRLLSSMREVSIDVVAELGRVHLGLRRVMSLRVGDVVRLRTAVDDSVSVRVGGVEKFSGVPVLSRGQLAIEIRSRRAR